MDKILLPPPSAFGLPAKFQAWREDQLQAFQLMLDAPTRFVGLTMPTGSGKTLSYMATVPLVQGRWVGLTATKGLQDQVAGPDGDFPGMVMDLRGQSNYPCKALAPGGEFQHFHLGHADSSYSCEDGPCHAGAKCTLKEAGCEYYDRIRMSQNLPLVTNYALWMAQQRYGQGIGKVDFLVLDEAHRAVDELAGALTIRLEKWLAAAVGITSQPPVGGPVQVWRDWAAFHANRLAKKQEGLGVPSGVGELKARRRMRQVERALRSMSEMEINNWVEDHTEQEWKFEVLNPAMYAEQLLFQGASKVVLLSATLTPKTLNLLGIQEATVWECPSRFPAHRRPVIYVPTCQVDSKKPENLNLLIGRADQIMDQRQQVKGIIHSVSYRRRDQVLALSRHNHKMLTHGNKSGEAQAVVKAFKMRQDGCILVSPSMTTGWDFPYDQCRYQIILKIPFPDTRSAVMKARCEMDPEYMPYLTCQALVQAVGRGMRAPDDWCETFIIDDHWKWFGGKYRKLMPRWFLEAVRTSLTIPPPLKEVA